MYTYSTTVLVDLSQHHCFIVLDLSIPFNSLPLNGFFKVGLYTFSRHLSSSSPFIVFSHFPVVAAFNRHLNLFSWYRAFMSGVQTLDWALDNYHSRRWTMLVTMDCMYVWNGFYGHISLNLLLSFSQNHQLYDFAFWAKNIHNLPSYYTTTAASLCGCDISFMEFSQSAYCWHYSTPNTCMLWQYDLRSRPHPHQISRLTILLVEKSQGVMISGTQHKRLS